MKKLKTGSSSSASKDHSESKSLKSTTESSDPNGNIILCISESRGVVTEIGIAVFYLESATCQLTQFVDNQSYFKTMHKVLVHHPKQILLPNTFLESNSKLVSLLKQNFERVQLITTNRKYFNEDKGIEMIEKYAFSNTLAQLFNSLESKYFGLSSLGALFSHLEFAHVELHPKAIKIEYLPIDGTMLILPKTIQDLELIQNNQNEKKTFSLFGVLDRCHTKMGSRLLKTNILQPLTSVHSLEQRLDAIEELLKDEAMFFRLKNSLKMEIDLDHLISTFVLKKKRSTVKETEEKLDALMKLNYLMSQLGEFKEILSHFECDLLVSICQVFEQPILQEWQETLSEKLIQDTSSKVPSRKDRAKAIKPRVSGLLDVARRTFQELDNDITQLVEDYRDQYSLPLKLEYQRETFYISLPVNEMQQLPEIFINLLPKKKVCECTTMDLIKLNQRAQNAMNEVLLLSDEIIQDLTEKILENISVLYQLADAIALLDLIWALADYVTKNQPVVRPEYTQTLALHQSAHPIKMMKNDQFVRNDCFCHAGSNFKLITGANMSGKSTYIKQIALIQIMAQIGCFVPAEYCSVRLCHQLLSCFPQDQSPCSNLSSFMSEMKTMSSILNWVTPQSLVLVDELGRGTSTYDGLGISTALAKDLAQSGAFVFFVTHFLEMVEILEDMSQVLPIYLNVTFDSDSIQYLYKVETGKTQHQNYGILLAEKVGYPSAIIEKAKEVAEELNDKMNTLTEARKHNSQSRNEKMAQMVHDQLMILVDIYRNKENEKWTPEMSEFMKNLYQKISC